MSLRVVFMGTPDFAAVSLKTLLDDCLLYTSDAADEL